jgi:hypothetical protein
MGNFGHQERNVYGRAIVAAGTNALPEPGKTTLTQAVGAPKGVLGAAARLQRAIERALADVANLEAANRGGDLSRALGLRSLVDDFIEQAPGLLAAAPQHGDVELTASAQALLKRAQIALDNAPQISPAAREAAQRRDYTLWDAELAPWRARASSAKAEPIASLGSERGGTQASTGTSSPTRSDSQTKATVPASVVDPEPASTSKEGEEARDFLRDLQRDTPTQNASESVWARELSSAQLSLNELRAALKAATEQLTARHIEALRSALARSKEAIESLEKLTDQLPTSALDQVSMLQLEYSSAQDWLATATRGGSKAVPAASARRVVATSTSHASSAQPDQALKPTSAMDWVATRVARASDGRDDAQAADAVVLAIEELSPDERQDLAERVNRYQPGNGDELAGQIDRLSVGTRRRIQSAFAGVQLGPWKQALGITEPEPQLGKGTFSPNVYIGYWRSRLIHELAIEVTAGGWPPLHPNVQWTADPAQLATALEVVLSELSSDAGFSTLLANCTHPIDAMALIAEYMDTHAGSGAEPAWQPHLVPRLGFAMRDAMLRALRRMARRLAARAAATQGATISSGDVIPTEPVDRVAIYLLCKPNVAEVSYVKGSPDKSSPDDFANGLRQLFEVEFVGERDPALWNWIHVQVPGDATREEVSHHLFGTATDLHSDQAYAISRVGMYFAVPMSLARGAPALMRFAPDDVRTRTSTSTITAQGCNDVVALAGSAIALEATATQPPNDGTPHQDEISASTANSIAALSRSQLADYNIALMELGVETFAAPATRWLDAVLAKSATEILPWSHAIRQQHNTITEAGQFLRQVAPTLLPAKNAAPAQEVARDLATCFGSAHLGDISTGLLKRARDRFAWLPMEGLKASARNLMQARLDISGVTRPAAHAGLEQMEQQDIDERMIALERQTRTGTVDQDAIVEHSVMQREYALRFRSQALRDQTLALSQALNDSNDGAISWLSNLGHNHDIDSAFARFAGISRRAQQLVATMEETIALGPQALMSKSDDGAKTRERRLRAVEAAEKGFEKLKTADFENDLKKAWEEAKDAERRSRIGHIVAQIAVLIGIGLVSGGIASWVGGAAGGFVESSLLARTALSAATAARTGRIVGGITQFTVDVAGNAIGQTLITGDSMRDSFVENLVTSGAMLVAMRPIQHLGQRARAELHAAESGAAHAAEGAGKLAAARRFWTYTKSGELALDTAVGSLELLAQAAVGYAVARAMHGPPKDEAQASSWVETGASLVIGRVVAGRMRGLEQRLQQHGQAAGNLLQRVRKQAQLAEGHAENPTPDAAWKLLDEYRGLLHEEAALLASPEAAKLPPEQLAELKRGNAQGFDPAEQGAIAAVALQRKLKPVSSDGVEWVGTEKDVEAAIAASGATVVDRDKTRVKIEVAGEHRTLFIGSNERADAPETPALHASSTRSGDDALPINRKEAIETSIDVEKLRINARLPFKSGSLTNAGRALTKHPEVLGQTKNTLRTTLRTDPEINAAAAEALETILQGTRTSLTLPRYGAVLEFRGPSGFGARFLAKTGEFIGFINP